MTDKNVPHVHAALIKAWADGASIQYKDKDWDEDDEWRDTSSPTWGRLCFYRVKPEPKPDIVRYRFMCMDQSTYPTKSRTPNDNIMFVFDGETGVLKDVQLLARE